MDAPTRKNPAKLISAAVQLVNCGPNRCMNKPAVNPMHDPMFATDEIHSTAKEGKCQVGKENAVRL